LPRSIPGESEIYMDTDGLSEHKIEVIIDHLVNKVETELGEKLTEEETKDVREHFRKVIDYAIEKRRERLDAK